MHPVNKILYYLGAKLVRVKKAPKEFISDYKIHFRILKENPPNGFKVAKNFFCGIGSHPKNHFDHECEFASEHIFKLKPKDILDIGSYRLLIIGLLGHYQVTTIDVRERVTSLLNETVITCDAKKLNLEKDSFDMVLSLCSLEHFGLGGYGDEFDMQADKKAFSEMKRVLRPGGHLIFTTTMTSSKPSIEFNMYKNYSYEMIREFCDGLKCIEEKFYSNDISDFVSLRELCTKAGYDVYFGCWQK